MADATKIEWCDHTFNPWIGCSKVHTGCANCYAEADFDKRRGFAKWGLHGTRVKTSAENWAKPLKWNRDAERDGVRRRVFCASLADVFEDWQGHVSDSRGNPLWINEQNQVESQALPGRSDTIFFDQGFKPARLDDLRMLLFELIDATPNLLWLLLTKRPENIMRMWPAFDVEDSGGFDPQGNPIDVPVFYRPNVFIGTSISDQLTADKMIPELLKCRDLSPVLFLSAEPLLGPIDLTRWLGLIRDRRGDLAIESATSILWVIVGGESGPHACPMHPQWVRDLRDQCQAAVVPFFFKQWGEWLPISEIEDSDSLYRPNRVAKPGQDQAEIDDVYGRTCRVRTTGVQYDGNYGWLGGQGAPPAYQTFKVGKKTAGRLLDGVVHDAFPEVEA